MRYVPDGAGARHISQATVQVNTSYSEGCSSTVQLHKKNQQYHSSAKAMPGSAGPAAWQADNVQGLAHTGHSQLHLLQSSAHMPSLLRMTGKADTETKVPSAVTRLRVTTQQQQPMPTMQSTPKPSNRASTPPTLSAGLFH